MKGHDNMFELVDKCNCDVFAIKKDKDGNIIDEHLIGNYDYYEIARDVAGTELYNIRKNESDYSYVEIRRYFGEKANSEYTSTSLNLDDVGLLDPWITKEEEDDCIKRMYKYMDYDPKYYKEHILNGRLKLMWSRYLSDKYIYFLSYTVGCLAIKPGQKYPYYSRDDRDVFMQTEDPEQFLNNNKTFYKKNRELINKLYIHMSIEPTESRVLFDLKYFNLFIAHDYEDNEYIKYNGGSGLLCAIDMNGNFFKYDFYNENDDCPDGLFFKTFHNRNQK